MDWLYSELLSAFLSQINTSFIPKLKLKIKIKTIAQNIKVSILNSFENEPFFNDLDKFLYTNKILSNFISNCTSSGIHSYTDITSFIENCANRFIESYPHYFAHKSIIIGTLTKIFSLTFNEINKIEDENTRVITNILKEHATVLEKSIAKIESTVDSIDDDTKKIVRLLEETLTKDIPLKIQMASSSITMPFTVPDINIDMLCERAPVVLDITESLAQYEWVHIVGSPWSGKTSLAMLLRAALNNRTLWIDFSYGNPVDIIKNFEIAFSNMPSNPLGHTVIIDNLPEIHLSSPFSLSFVSIVNKLKEQNCKFISFGTYSVPNTILSQTNLTFLSKNLPDFCEDDIINLMNILDAPKHLFSDRTHEFLLVLTGRKPAAIRILLEFLKANKWDINTEIFSHILTLDIEELTNQINIIVAKTITDDKTRELLYRISIVGYPVTRTEIEKIANVEPRINLVGEKLNKLRGFWITGENFLSVNSVLRTVSQENLSEDIRVNINSMMADSLLSKQALNQLDITRAITHLIVAKRADEAGQVYIRAMQSMCEEHIEYDESFIFSRMWIDMPLPQNMSLHIKAGIRFFQIWYDAQQNKENSYSVLDLIQLSEGSLDMCDLLIAAGAMIAPVNYKSAIALISHAKKQGMPEQSALYEQIGFNPIAGIISIMIPNMEKISDIMEWFSFVKNILTDGMIMELENSSFTHLFTIAFEKTRECILLHEIGDLISLILEIRQYASNHLWNHLVIGCDITLLRIEGINKANYTSAKMMYEECIKETDKKHMANMQYCIGLIAFDNKDFTFAATCLCNAGSCIDGLDDTDKVYCFLHCSFAFSNEHKYFEAQAAINQALQVATNSLSIFEEVRKNFLVKIHFEKVVCCYLSQALSTALDSLDYVLNYLSCNSAENNEHIIAIVLHCLVYILEDTIKKQPPKKHGEEDYVKPFVGIMWFQNNNDSFKDGSSEAKLAAINICASQLYHRFKEFETSNKWLLHSSYLLDSLQNKDMLYTLFSLNCFTLFRLFEQAEYESASNILLDLLNHSVTKSPSNLLTGYYVLTRLSLFFILHECSINNFLPFLKKHNPSGSLGNIWTNWLNMLESYNVIDDANYWINKGNQCKSGINNMLQSTCYMFATKTANLKQLLSLYLSVLSGLDQGLFCDTYWINYILIPLIKSQFSICCKQDTQLKLIFDEHSLIIDGYIIDSKKVKLFLKGFTDFYGENSFKPEHINWLNS